uniref:Uncharacterized protein n=1 Tax=Anguilla anguilla TaxID=7936 RepID=A0A0E9TIQ3_ANGAN
MCCNTERTGPGPADSSSSLSVWGWDPWSRQAAEKWILIQM